MSERGRRVSAGLDKVRTLLGRSRSERDEPRVRALPDPGESSVTELPLTPESRRIGEMSTPVDVRVSSLGLESAARGGARLALDRVFTDPTTVGRAEV